MGQIQGLRPGNQIDIRDSTYLVLPYMTTNESWQEHKEALHAQLQKQGAQAQLFRLKVMKPPKRSESLRDLQDALQNHYARQSGFRLLQGRICLTKEQDIRLIRAFPELECALLMSELRWPSWESLLQDIVQGRTWYSQEQAIKLSSAMAQVLQTLEEEGHAHTDIAGRNVLVDPNFEQVALLDLEGFYMPMPHLNPPASPGLATPGYQHLETRFRRSWSSVGDRFAGAILLTEMLTLWAPEVRATLPHDATSLFTQDEIQEVRGDMHYQQVSETLRRLPDSELLDLFRRAWKAATLLNCPSLTEWASAIQQIQLPARPDVPVQELPTSPNNPPVFRPTGPPYPKWGANDLPPTDHSQLFGSISQGIDLETEASNLPFQNPDRNVQPLHLKRPVLELEGETIPPPVQPIQQMSSRSVWTTELPVSSEAEMMEGPTQPLRRRQKSRLPPYLRRWRSHLPNWHPDPRWWQQRWIMVAGVACALLLLVLGSIITDVVVNQRNATIFAQQATATAVAQNPDRLVPSETLQILDPMDKAYPGFGWLQLDNESANKCIYKNNAYHVTGRCSSGGSLYYVPSKFTFEINLAAEGNCGVVELDFDNDQTSFSASVCQDGHYGLLSNDTVQNKVTQINSGTSSAIHSDPSASNVIDLVADGSTLSLYVNGTFLQKIDDVVKSKGYIALWGVDTSYVKTSADSDYREVSYTYARLWY